MSKWSRIFRKASAWALAAVLIGSYADIGALSAFPAYAASEAASEGKEVILSFRELPAEITEQKSAQGTEESELEFPEVLTVTLASESLPATPANTSRKASASDASSSDADIDGVYLDEDGELPDGEVIDNVNLEQEAELTGVKWRLKKEESSAEALSAGIPGDSFLYEPEIPAGYALADDAVLPQILVVIEDGAKAAAPAAFEMQKTIDGVTVTVSAETGAFPADAVLVVEKVPAAKKEKAEAAVAEQRETDRSVAVSYTFDIRIEDGTGQELQPAEGKQVKVAFSMAEAADENLSADIYHIKENTDGASAAAHTGDAAAAGLAVEKLTAETDAAAETVTAETDGFSLYTVEFTYKSLTFAMSGGAEVPLSDILSAVGLNGEATAVEVSDSTLFSAEIKDGAWVVISHQAFSSDEWMKVTISGIVYEIRVTDAKEVSTWAELKEALAEDGTVKLMKKVTAVSSDLYLQVPSGKTVTLDLNGKIIDRQLSAPRVNGFVILVLGNLTLTDSGTGGTITGGYCNNALSGNCEGGGIYVGKNAVFIMEKGKISENKAEGPGASGGGVFVGEKASFTMKGGEISGNESLDPNENGVSFGGGVYVRLDGTFNIEKGTISGNKASQGAGIANEGTLNMSGGTISNNNEADKNFDGGGVWNDGKFIMTEGTITGNQVKRCGGGVSNLGTMQLSGGTITQNEAGLDGGGIYVFKTDENTSVSMEGDVTVKENTASSDKCNLFLSNGMKIAITGALTGTASVGVTTKEKPGTVPVDFAAASSHPDWAVVKNFTSDDPLYEVRKNTEEKLALFYKKKTVSVNGITAKNKVYDKTSSATLDLSTAQFPEKDPSDQLKLTAGNGSFADYHAGTGKTVNITGLVLGGTDAWKYELASDTSTATASITPKEVGLIWGITTFDYDGSTHIPTVSVNSADLLGGDSCSVTSVSGGKADAGPWTAKADALSNPDYKLPADPTTGFTINPKEIGLIWTNTTLDYNGTAQGPTADATGLEGSDICHVAVTGAEADAGTWTAKADSIDNTNYKLPAANTTSYTINRAPLTVTTPDAEKVYDGTPLTAGGSMSGLVGSETATFTTTGTRTDVGSSSNTYSIVWDGTAKQKNYDITDTIGTLKVTEYAGQIDVTTTGGTFTYDGLAHGAAVDVSPLPAGYTLISAASGAVVTDVTSSPVTVTADTLVIQNAGGTDVTDKLNIKKKDGTITITPAPVTVTTPDASKVYDGTPLTAAGNISGLMAGETATFTTTGSQTKAGSSSNTCSITWDGTAKETNYTLAGETLGTLTVTKKEVSVPSGITAYNKFFDSTKDATLDLSGAVISGMLDGDQVTVEGNGIFESALPGNGRKVFISGITLTGADAGNYTLAPSGNQTETTADIRRLPESGENSDSWSSDTPGHWNQNGYIWTYSYGDGSPAKGWNFLVYHGKGDWYFFDQDGIMQDGWIDWNSGRYYLFPISDGWRGRMLTGWQLIDGSWYFFEPVSGMNQGRMYRNETTPDGYRVNENGVWVR